MVKVIGLDFKWKSLICANIHYCLHAVVIVSSCNFFDPLFKFFFLLFLAVVSDYVCVL